MKITYVNAEGDGLDTNGDILMTGGDVTVHGPTNGGNGTLDFGGTCKIDGGIFARSLPIFTAAWSSRCRSLRISLPPAQRRRT